MDQDTPASPSPVCRRCGLPLSLQETTCPRCGPDPSSLPPEGKPLRGTGETPPTPESEAPEAAAGDREGSHEIVRPPRTLLGLGFGIAGGGLAMMVWYGFTAITGWEFGIIAWGVGIAAGVSAIYGAGRASALLGIMAGCIAGLAIIGGQLLTFRRQVDSFVRKEAKEAYERELAFARVAAKERNPSFLRPLLAERDAEEGEQPDPRSVTNKDLKKFVEEEQPFLQGLLEGNPSREEYVDDLVRGCMERISLTEALRESFSLWTVLWLFLGVGTAWKIGSGHSSRDEEGDTPRRARRKHAFRSRRGGLPHPGSGRSGRTPPPDGDEDGGQAQK
jgi:hypothetical protein